jgi:hypothetical protein
MRHLLQAVILSSAIQTSTVTPPQTPAAAVHPTSGFALRFDHKGCHFEYLDTFRGTYSDVGAHPRVPFTLSNEQRQKIFDAIMAAKFFDRPAVLGVGPEAGNNYELEVRNGGRRHSVQWTVDSAWFQSEEGRPMRLLQDTIFQILEHHSDVLRLPRRGDGCATGPRQFGETPVGSAASLYRPPVGPPNPL